MSDKTLAVKGTEQVSHTQLVAREFAQRLKYMLVNGQKLADHDVFALAQYASATGLDPFAGECWIIPGKGVCPGIAGWRKKAQEQLEYEAKDAKQDGAHFWVEFIEATPGDCVFDPTKGDIAYTSVLRDSISQHRWRSSIIEATNEFMKMGAKFDESLKQAKELVGKEPLWIGHGVVFSGENFGGLDKFDRIERAQKRAEKLALRKRFPRIHLPEPEGVNDVVDAGDFSIAVDDIKPHTLEENMSALGFGNDEPTEQRNYVMTYKQACDVTGKEGERYGNLSNKELEGKKIGISKMLKEKSLDAVTQQQCERKLEAIKVLLAVPEGDRLEREGQPTLDIPAEGSGG